MGESPAPGAFTSSRQFFSSIIERLIHLALRPIAIGAGVGRVMNACRVVRVAIPLAVLLTAAVAAACDTPVYRYALYNWLPTDYRVYYLYDGDEDPADDAVLTRLNAASDAEPARINAELTKVNLAAHAPDHLPEELERWQHRHPDVALPVFAVFSPHGGELYTGKLEVSDVDAMVDSVARRRAAELLEEGHTTVLILLEADDEALMADAHEAINEVAQRAATGEIVPRSLGSIDVVEFGDDTRDVLSVAVLSLRRDDPNEEWFVRTLLSVEPDLDEYDEPMVFALYGRGRAMEPFIGPGITAGNLSDCISFLAGACSCEVKEQNPGMDLLMAWDWESAAMAVASRAGEEQGNEDLISVTSLLPAVLGTANEEPLPADLGLPSDDVADESDEAEEQPPAVATLSGPDSRSRASYGADAPATSISHRDEINRQMLGYFLAGAGTIFVVLVGVTFIIVTRRTSA